MNIAVIGAGWAGAAAAWQLHKNGLQATVFEASHTIGGRARKHNSTALGQLVDNGQHILLGAYSATLQLMQELQIDLERSFYRSDLDIYSADGSFRFKTAPLPAPLHVAGALFNAKGVSIKERLRLIRLSRYLEKNHWLVPTGMTVLELLQHTQQPQVLIQKLWHPLCIAALNTPIQMACAQLFAHVLRDSLNGKRADAQMLIPLVNMTDLWAQKALAYADIHLGKPIRHISPQGSKYHIADQAFDGVIIATNTPSAMRLLQNPGFANQNSGLVDTLGRFRFNQIATLYLRPETSWNNPYPMLMLDEDLTGLAAGQWVFNHAAMPQSELGHMIAVTISYADRLQDHSKADITAAIIKQIQQQSRYPLPTITHSELITEKRATFVATPGLARPDTHTPWEGIKLAGDWVRNDYPAVLEGAVRSGIKAADAFM